METTDNFDNMVLGRVVHRLLFFFTIFFLITNSSKTTAQTSSQGSSITSNLINIEAPASETFRYQATLKNGAGSAQVFQLSADVPEGWRLVFKARGSQVTSINVEPDRTESISIEIKPAYGAEPAQYPFTVHAISDRESLQLALEAVVEGSYEMELTTPSGLLSGEITEGKKAEITLRVKNTGSLALNEITLSAQTPSRWEATFSPSEIAQLDPGETVDLIATVTVPEKTLAGDYVTKFTAKNTSGNSTATYRMTVKTSVLSGWVGILVILIAIGFVFYLIRKFGRR
ncbi:NPCBM-associated, NEW3 domain of alpha-galactosidase [Cyclobacterium lianum]|uniref:NPCBM-associated, NEW3 domain of alpha-galactosidase n=1 Tax=Cyclobacterium lianum TaxID=388280 RepID=A0A1M7PCV6_9BACT|nr:NEW3 domain-containing protein [Cyclobacterium lianum]SHN14424.1 NPCBM-associated, NEW3 domain of alpha-galactosidase [Cyclobacterium lianum]